LNVQLVGKVENKKIYELHRKTWVLMFPSITEELLPYAVAEAMALGTIPIASKVGGIPEITKDTSAENFLFVPGNIDELINKIKMMMSQPQEKIISIGIRLKEHATKLFDSKKINSRILRVFNSDGEMRKSLYHLFSKFLHVLIMIGIVSGYIFLSYYYYKSYLGNNQFVLATIVVILSISALFILYRSAGHRITMFSKADLGDLTYVLPYLVFLSSVVEMRIFGHLGIFSIIALISVFIAVLFSKSSFRIALTGS